MKKPLAENIISAGYLIIALSLLTYFINFASTASTCYEAKSCNKTCSKAGSSQCIACVQNTEVQGYASPIHQDGNNRAASAYCGKNKKGTPTANGSCSSRCNTDNGTCGNLKFNNTTCMHDS